MSFNIKKTIAVLLTSVIMLAGSGITSVVSASPLDTNEEESSLQLQSEENSQYSVTCLGHSLSLENGYIGVIFYFEFSDYIASHRGEFCVVKNSPNGSNWSTELNRDNENGITWDDDTHGHTIIIVYPKQMTDIVSVQFSYGDMTKVIGYDYVWESGEFNYTVADYYQFVADESNASKISVTGDQLQDLRDLARSLVIYGTYTQEYFDYNTNTPACTDPQNAAGLIEVSDDSVELQVMILGSLYTDESYLKSNYEYIGYSWGTEEEVRFVGLSLNLLYVGTTNIYFSVAEGCNITSIEGGNGSIQQDGDYFYTIGCDYQSAFLSSRDVIVVNYTNAAGEPCSFTFLIGAPDFVYMVMTNPDDYPEDLVNLVSSMYSFYRNWNNYNTLY